MAFKHDIDYEKIRKRVQEARKASQGYKVSTGTALAKMLGIETAKEMFDYQAAKGLDTGAKVQQHYDQLVQAASPKPTVQQQSVSSPQPVAPQISAPAPYSSPYQAQVDALLQQILNPKAFSYDALS